MRLIKNALISLLDMRSKGASPEDNPPLRADFSVFLPNSQELNHAKVDPGDSRFPKHRFSTHAGAV
jgi:hypothetical protein